jgi:hypothetical protein
LAGSKILYVCVSLGVCRFLHHRPVTGFNKRKTTTPKEKTRKKKKQETCPIFRILFLFLGVTFLFSLLQ